MPTMDFSARLLHSARTMCVVALMSFSCAVAFAQSPPPQQSDVSSIEGTVRSSKGEPVGGASVFLEDKGESAVAETKTKTDGSFLFSAVRRGAYALRAEKSGVRSAAVASVVLSEGERKRVDMVLEDSRSSSPMEFADKPDFTVAGVTDGSNIGGHGSDTNLRTSEALARETAALKSRGAGTTTTATNPENRETENKLRAALAQAPGSFEANHELGQFYLRSERYLEAIPLLQAAYQINSANYA